MLKSKESDCSAIHFSLLCTLTLIVMLSLTSSAIARCLTELYSRVVCNKAAAADGKKHIVVSFEGSDNLNAYSAVRAAMDEWNKYSDITGVVFEPAQWGATNGDLHIRFSTNPDATQGCAAYQPSAGPGIYWGVEFQGRITTPGLGDAQLASPLMHELGHFLGLDHFPPGTQPPTIMNQTADCSSPTDVNNVTQSDAEEVRDCLAQNCAAPHPPISHGGGGSTCGYEPTMDPTYDNEGNVTGYEINYIYMCY